MSRLLLTLCLLLSSCRGGIVTADHCIDFCKKRCNQALDELSDRCAKKYEESITKVQQTCAGGGSLNYDGTSRFRVVWVSQYQHPKAPDDWVVEVELAVDRSIKQRRSVQCFYYEGARTDQYIERKEWSLDLLERNSSIDVGQTNYRHVRITTRLTGVPKTITAGHLQVRVECHVGKIKP